MKICENCCEDIGVSLPEKGWFSAICEVCKQYDSQCRAHRPLAIAPKTGQHLPAGSPFNVKQGELSCA